MKRFITLQMEVEYGADTNTLAEAIDEAKSWAAMMTFTDPGDWTFVSAEEDE